MASSLKAATLLLLLSVDALAQSPRVALEPFLNALNQPVYLTNAHDGSNRKFVIEQPGRILVVQPNSVSPTVFLDIRSRILTGDERGLLGLAFHPQFSTNRRFFVNYTRRPDGATVIAEYRALDGSPNLADPNSEVVLLLIPQPYANHNGGMIEFGPDNFLYIGMGDGGSGNDPENRAQNKLELLGKILRIDVDKPTGASVPYSSPSTNPFFGPETGRDEIFAYGFRNPWRFSFDRLTGELFAGDVGQNAREEIDVVSLGGNYGWRVFEGTRCTNLDAGSCSVLDSIPPVAEYTNGQLGRCSVTGGYVYRGTRNSLPYGSYVFADFCTGEIFLFQGGLPTLLLDTSLNISSFGVDESGEIYVVGLAGSVQRLVNPDSSPTSQRPYAIPARGVEWLPSNGAGLPLVSGFGRVQASTGNALPSGLAILGLHKGGVLISEASVPAAPLMQSGRIFASVAGSVNTGIALVNPGTLSVTVGFYFTDSAGQNFRQGTVVLNSGQKIAAFLNESPFNGGAIVDGTFTFSASGPISAIAIRGLINDRGEFLMTTLPVVSLTASSTVPVAFPHWAQGDGWSTEFVLVNPSDGQISGNLDLRDTKGSSTMTLPYTLQARSSQRLVLPVAEGPARSGSGSIVPVLGPTPSGMAVFRHATSEGVITEAGVAAVQAGTAFRGYAELTKSVRTGLAVANLSPAAATASVELIRLDGTSVQAGTLSLPALGQNALFLDEVPGLALAEFPFQGTVRVTSSVPIAVTGLRTRVNERGDFLIAASAPADESAPVSGPELLFPHLVVGGGYDLQVVLLNLQSSPQSGTVHFLDQNGQPLFLLLP